ncbi:MAG: hypothetical protein JNL50_09515 [Phycisphaerae bacterium]|nr:hypothetical protein [Phycisphaerae bacterium]
MPQMVRTIAACLGLTAFAVAVAAGLLTGNPAGVVLGRALLALVVGQMLGVVIGQVGTRVVEDQLRAYVSSNPHSARREVSTGSPPAERDAREAA